MNIRSKFPDEISELWFLQYTHGVYLYYDYWLFDNQSDLLKQSIIVINILINQTLPRLEHRAYHKNDYSGRMIISYCVNFHVHSQRNVTNVSLRNFQIFTQHTHTQQYREVGNSRESHCNEIYVFVRRKIASHVPLGGNSSWHRE